MREFKRKKSDASTALKNGNNRDFFGVQAKLNVGRPGDKYEKEADHIADKVVNKTANLPGIQKMGNGEQELQQKPLAETISTVQKQELKEEEKEVQAKCTDCEKEESVQKKAETEEEEPVQKQEEEEIQAKSNTMQFGISDNNELESKLSDKKGMGNKMGAGEKQEMEAGFGADFSNVNIHTDGNAEQMSEQLGAQAFTHGNDIYFNKGKYNPGSAEGKHLLAHELTHTIQQGNSKSPGIQKLSDPDCDGSFGLPHSGSCSGYRNTCYTETFIPAGSGALNISVSVEYDSPAPPGFKEDVSVQVYKCGTLWDTKIGSKRISEDNIPLTMNVRIASVTPGDKYYVKIYSRSNERLTTRYNISQ